MIDVSISIWGSAHECVSYFSLLFIAPIVLLRLIIAFHLDAINLHFPESVICTGILKLTTIVGSHSFVVATIEEGI